MRKSSKIIFPAIIVVLGILVLYFFGQGGSDGQAFMSSNTGVRGTSLFFDTLQHMGYPVGVSRRPLTLDTDTGHVYVIIQPTHPPCNCGMREMLDWAERGGRLIFLQNWQILDVPAVGIYVADIVVYELGRGAVITGNANAITNQNLMNNADIGIQLYTILTHWNADMIMFAEYYHIAPVGDNLFSRLPLIVRLVFIQLGLAAIIAIWHFGKRFGNPLPYYDETEREENEHVYTVTRLYLKTRRK